MASKRPETEQSIPAARRRRPATWTNSRASLTLAGRVGNGQPATDLPRQQVRDFGVARNGFHVTGLWILPKGMFFTLAAQHAPVTPEVPEKSLALHPTITGSCLASGGKARSDSSRRCARISAIASRKFARHSSCVVPWPFAPGTSAQYATNQGPSLSTIAVNSFRMTVF